MSLVDITAALTDSSIQYQAPTFFERRAFPQRVVGANYIAFDSRIKACADARIGYAAHPGVVTVQHYGSIASLASASDVTGISVDGSTSRFARVADPDDAGKWCWRFRVHPDDPDTASSKRGEFAFTGASGFAEKNARVFGCCIRMQDWTALADDQLVFQVHGPDAGAIGNPWLSFLVTAGVFRISLRYDVNESPDPGTQTILDLYTQANWTPLQWYRFVVFVREDWRGNGAVRVLRDGVELVDYEGPVGYNNQAVGASYLKSGYYHWVDSGNDWDTAVNTREVWQKGAYITDESVSLTEMDSFLAEL